MNLKVLLGCLACALWFSGGVARSEPPLPTLADLATLQAQRFPQLVRVGDLSGRKVMLPLESHRVLGRVSRIVRSPSGELDAVLDYGGILGFATHPIAVPTDAIALLGADLVMIGYTPAQLDGFAPFVSAGSTPIPPDEMIKMGLTGPSH